LGAYFFCAVLLALAGAYSHLFSAIFILSILMMRYRLREFLVLRNLTGYLVLVFVFETVVESLFWLGGFRMLKDITLLDVLLVNLPFWLIWGVLLYLIASKFDFGPISMIILAGLTGVLVEMPKTLIAGWPLHSLILAAFINAVNYSFVVGFPFLLIRMQPSSGESRLRRRLVGGVAGIVVPYIFVLVYMATFVTWVHDALYPRSPMISLGWWAEYVQPNWIGFAVVLILTILSLAYIYKKT